MQSVLLMFPPCASLRRRTGSSSSPRTARGRIPRAAYPTPLKFSNFESNCPHLRNWRMYCPPAKWGVRIRLHEHYPAARGNHIAKSRNLLLALTINESWVRKSCSRQALLDLKHDSQSYLETVGRPLGVRKVRPGRVDDVRGGVGDGGDFFADRGCVDSGSGAGVARLGLSLAHGCRDKWKFLESETPKDSAQDPIQRYVTLVTMRGCTSQCASFYAGRRGGQTEIRNVFSPMIKWTMKIIFGEIPAGGKTIFAMFRRGRSNSQYILLVCAVFKTFSCGPKSLNHEYLQPHFLYFTTVPEFLNSYWVFKDRYS